MALIDRTFREKIVIVGVVRGGTTVEEAEASLDELALLVDTAGADVVARTLQRRENPDPATYVGSGKAEELREISEAVDSDTVIFDDELSPAQSRNLEKILGRTAIDRTALILDIFGQHAHTQQGKLQVELAQLRYRLPRLRGKTTNLAQQAGGVGAGGIGTRTRGAGETQLELDRRHMLQRIGRLEKELKDLRRTRETARKSRKRNRIPTVAIVGYTNAGKSTLLNRLTDAGVLVEDRLFATLDPTTRRLELPGGEPVLLSDTVGFVRKLPHQLVEAFRSTLEETAEADLLLHVVDGSAADPDGQIRAVRAVLGEIGADEIPELLAFNKADVAVDPAQLVADHAGSVAFSALTGDGVDLLLATLADRLRAMANVVELVVPYDRGDVLAALHREGEVLVESHEDDGTRVRARLHDGSAGRFRDFVVSA